MRGDRDLDTYKQAEAWVAKHYRHIIVGALAVAFFSVLGMFVVNSRCAKMLQAQAKAIDNLSNKVILVRADGKVVSLEKEALSQTYLQYALRDLVVNQLVLSGLMLDEHGVESLEDMEKIDKVRKMAFYLTKTGASGYKSYLDFLLSNKNNDNVPEVIWVNEVVDEIVYQDNRFKYSAKLLTTVYYVKNLKWNEGKGEIAVSLKGYVDISKSTPENPFGIFINQLEVTKYVGKEPT